MAKLLGFQFADLNGNNIQGDDNDPVGATPEEMQKVVNYLEENLKESKCPSK